MMIRKIQSRQLTKLFTSAAVVFFLSMSSASAEYLFTAPPRETPEQGEAVYGPLAAEISRIINAKVTYQHPGNWIAYRKKVQSGQYDFIFDGPHFAAWRLQNLEVEPLVKLPGSLSFVLVSDYKNDTIKSKDDLVSKKICTLPSPNLGTLSAYSMYPNQVRQPKFVMLKGGFKNVAKGFQSGKCDAALLRESFFKHGLDDKSRRSLKVLEASKQLTNQGITISKRINEQKQKEIRDFLTSEKGVQISKPLLKRFSKGDQRFIPAQHNDYQGHNLLVENMIFGW